MSAQITYRMARPDDSGELARYMCIAGGGVYEFLFDNLIPFVTAHGAREDRDTVASDSFLEKTIGDEPDMGWSV